MKSVKKLFGFGGTISLLLAAAVILTPDLALAAETPRMPGHVDSWAALVIILISLSVAVLLNGEKPSVRVGGTLLAAAGCFAVFVWFLWALSTGIIASPRLANNPPFPTLKPFFISAQALVALAAGLALLWAARAQSRRTDRLDLASTNSAQRYGRVSRWLHWTIAGLIVVLVPLGTFTSMIPEGTSFRLGYYVTHRTLGLTVLLLALVRIGWNFYSARPGLSSEIKPWERRTARTSHILLYVLIFGFPVSGYFMSGFIGIPVTYFIWDVPSLVERNEAAIIIPALLHKVALPYLFYIIIGAHVAGALKHQLIDRHRMALNRMVS